MDRSEAFWVEARFQYGCDVFCLFCNDLTDLLQFDSWTSFASAIRKDAEWKWFWQRVLRCSREAVFIWVFHARFKVRTNSFRIWCLLLFEKCLVCTSFGVFFIIFSSLVHLFYLLPLTNFCWTVEFNISLIFMFRSILPLKTTISPSSFQSFHFLISLSLYEIISIFVDYLVVYCLFCFLFFSAQHDAKIVQKV